MSLKGRVRNRCDREEKPNGYVESGVPYETATVYSINYANSGLTIEEHLIKFIRLVAPTLCPHKHHRATPDIRGQGSGAKWVRVKEQKTK